MPKQIGVSQSFDSIVYTRTFDVIATPMFNCFVRTGRTARQRSLRIVYLNLDLDLAPTAIAMVPNTDVASHLEPLWRWVTGAGTGNPTRAWWRDQTTAPDAKMWPISILPRSFRS